MTRHTEDKPLVDKLMLAGLGSGCLLFAVGTLTKIPPLSVFGFLASTGAGSVSYVMRENTKNLLTKDKDEVMQQKITHLIDEVLEPFADAFSKIKTCNFMKDSKEVNQLLKWLQLIDHYEWIPPAILYLKKYGHEPEKILKFFTDLERLAAGLMILRIHKNTRIKRYANILKEIEKDGDLYLSDSSLQLSILEQETIINLLNGNLFQMPKFNRYVLQRLDTFIAGGIPNYDGYKEMTIEHVLPQTPQATSRWMTDFPSKNIRANYVHRLGNLVLLSLNKNAAALNNDFAVKKETYFKNPVTTFALTIKVLQEIEWTPDIIEKRQEYLLKQLQKLWRLTMC